MAITFSSSRFKQLIIFFLSIITFAVSSGCTSKFPLITASLNGDFNSVKKFVEQGEQVNIQDCISGFDYICCTPITCAANNNHINIVKYLHEHGADINTIDASGNWLGINSFSLLHHAAYRNNVELANFLLSKGADTSATTNNGFTPLTLAKARGNTAVSALLAAEFKKQYADTEQARDANQATSPPPLNQPDQVVADKTSIVADIERNIPTGKPAGRYDVAVVIGNANYSATGTPNVDYALRDAQIMRQYLIKAFGFDPGNILYLENASLAKMSEVFGTDNDYQGKLYKWVKPGQSKIFIYYVGHGAPDQQSGEGYFVPVDANPQYIRNSGYKLSTFYANVSKIPAAKKTVVIDACFSGSSANGQLLKGISGITARLTAEPTASFAADLLLTSAGMNQVASWYPEKGHSLFTYFFLKGLQGEADANKDGHIAMGEMRTYLGDEVPYMARRLTGNEQTPVIMGKDSDDLIEFPR